MKIQEQEDDTREEEAARQKEFLEKVVISQKGQLRQLEKVEKIEIRWCDDLYLCSGPEVEQRKDAAGQQSPAEGDWHPEKGDGGDEEVQGETACDKERGKKNELKQDLIHLKLY